jgi:hypothetical protein
MPSTTRSAGRLAPYVQELLDNEYARDNLREGADRLRAAYERSRKRRVKVARDGKLRRQIGSAAASIAEGSKALSSGRRKPRRRGRRMLPALALGVGVGAGVALAAKPELRARAREMGSPPGGGEQA